MPSAAPFRRFAAFAPPLRMRSIRSCHGDEAYPFRFSALDMDCIDLAGLRPGGCDADGVRDAVGRYASRVGKAVPDVSPLMAAMGAGDAAHHAPWTAVSPGEAWRYRDVACACRRLCPGHAGLCRVAFMADFSSQPLCVCGGPGTLRLSAVRKVL